jgi:hypothetical protein
MSWIARGILIIAGVVASWFMSKDSPQFIIMEAALAIFLIAFVVGVLAFWPERWTHFVSRIHKPR